jgi:hypothetical protein
VARARSRLEPRLRVTRGQLQAAPTTVRRPLRIVRIPCVAARREQSASRARAHEVPNTARPGQRSPAAAAQNTRRDGRVHQQPETRAAGERSARAARSSARSEARFWRQHRVACVRPMLCSHRRSRLLGRSGRLRGAYRRSPRRPTSSPARARRTVRRPRAAGAARGSSWRSRSGASRNLPRRPGRRHGLASTSGRDARSSVSTLGQGRLVAKNEELQRCAAALTACVRRTMRPASPGGGSAGESAASRAAHACPDGLMLSRRVSASTGARPHARPSARAASADGLPAIPNAAASCSVERAAARLRPGGRVAALRGRLRWRGRCRLAALSSRRVRRSSASRYEGRISGRAAPFTVAAEVEGGYAHRRHVRCIKFLSRGRRRGRDVVPREGLPDRGPAGRRTRPSIHPTRPRPKRRRRPRARDSR